MREEKLAGLYRRFWKEHKPVSTLLEITDRCNLRCRFCFVADHQRKTPDIPRTKLFRIIDQLAMTGCMEVIIQGGEPLIRKDFLDIYDYIAGKGIFMTIYSNGTLLNREILNRIKKYPFHYLRISLYGMSPQTYEELSASRQAYRQVMQGIKLAEQAGVKFGFHTVLTKINQKDLSRIQKLARRLKVPYSVQKHLTCKTDGSTKHYKLSTTRGGRKPMCNGCIFIDNTSRLSRCPVMREQGYNLERVSFKNAWRNRLKHKIRIKCPRT